MNRTRYLIMNILSAVMMLLLAVLLEILTLNKYFIILIGITKNDLIYSIIYIILSFIIILIIYYNKLSNKIISHIENLNVN
jgi:membrane protein DedA with SNARE-associated domain